MNDRYDAIVIGARCAGSPTAMLLARTGYRVLVVDRATFPSDTVSTHLVHAPGVASLRRWGLLDQVIESGCPPIDTHSFNFGPFTIAGTPRPSDGISTAYAPRRTILDTILVDGARAAGAEIRERFSVDGLLVEDGEVTGIRGHDANGDRTEERARVVIGADGYHSHVVRAMKPEQYNERPAQQHSYYTYWSGLPLDRFTTFIRPDRGFAAIPTNEGLTLVAVAWPTAEVAAYRSDPEGNYLKTLELVPEFADRVRQATRVERFYGASMPNLFRKPFGPGWALVGDAGYTKDPITAQGISDAFHDAELCAAALIETFGGGRPYDDAMAAYQRLRDERVTAIYEFTTELASLAPPPPELQQLLAAACGSQEAMNAFVSVTAGTMSPVEFFHPDHVAGIFAAAAA